MELLVCLPTDFDGKEGFLLLNAITCTPRWFRGALRLSIS